MVICFLATCVDVSKNCKGNANMRNCVFGVDADVQHNCKKSCGQCGKFEKISFKNMIEILHDFLNMHSLHLTPKNFM